MYLIYFITFRYPNYNDLHKLTYTEPIPGIAKRARWRLLGHILRQPIGTPGNQAMMAYLTAEETTRHRKGAPQSCLVTTLQRDCKLTAVAVKTEDESTPRNAPGFCGWSNEMGQHLLGHHMNIWTVLRAWTVLVVTTISGSTGIRSTDCFCIIFYSMYATLLSPHHHVFIFV